MLSHLRFRNTNAVLTTKFLTITPIFPLSRRMMSLSFENTENASPPPRSSSSSSSSSSIRSSRSLDSFMDDFDSSPSSSSRSSFGFSSNYERESAFTSSNIMWDSESLTPFQKDFYEEHPDVAAMTDEEVQMIRDNGNMTLYGDRIPKPFRTFEKSGVPTMYLEHVKRMGITDPTPIQQQGIPMALSGRDVVGISRTGSGKTLSYLLPGIVHINAQEVVSSGQGPIALVLAPTRELTMQIADEVGKFSSSASYSPIRYAAVYGGADRHRQIGQLRRLPEILVATPGRLLDLLSAGETNFKRCTYVVLDEADRMLDMGFRQDIEKILSYIRPDRQMLMWSATWPKDIQAIATKYMRAPIRVQVGSQDLQANQNINQYFRQVENWDKETVFLSDVEEIVQQNKKALVFCNTKRNANDLERLLQSNGIRADAIHGDKTQARRDSIMKAFRREKGCVLIATDVVARGIDVRDIDVVVVYDFPSNVPDYVHRIGRTGRGHDKGISLTYLNNGDIDAYGRDVAKLLVDAKQTVPSFLQNLQARMGTNVNRNRMAQRKPRMSW